MTCVLTDRSLLFFASHWLLLFFNPFYVSLWRRLFPRNVRPRIRHTNVHQPLSLSIYICWFVFQHWFQRLRWTFISPSPPPFVYLFVCLVGWFSIQWSSIYVFLLCLRENHWWPESSCCTTFTSKLNFTYTWLRFSNVRDILLNSLKIHKNISDVKCGKWCMLVVFMRKVCIMGYYTVSGRYRFYIRAARTISTSERRGEEGLFLSLGHKIHIFKLA